MEISRFEKSGVICPTLYLGLLLVLMFSLYWIIGFPLSLYGYLIVSNCKLTLKSKFTPDRKKNKKKQKKKKNSNSAKDATNLRGRILPVDCSVLLPRIQTLFSLNLKLISIGVRELFEPIVLQKKKKKDDGFLLLLKAL